MSTAIVNKLPLKGHFIKLLDEKIMSSGMTLISEMSRCVKKNDIHKIVTTNQKNLSAGNRVDNVGFLGFAEFSNPGVIEVGDVVNIKNLVIGKVIGFDNCHYPNHYNILIQTSDLLTSSEINLAVEHSISFEKESLDSKFLADKIISVIVGFGYAGKNLHFSCLSNYSDKISQRVTNHCEQIYVIDPMIKQSEMRDNLVVIKSFDDIPCANKSNIVVHVCTQPAQHCAVIEKAAEYGLKKIIVEKPVADNVHDFAHIKRLEAKFGLDVLVVSNWSSSNLTFKLLEHIEYYAQKNIRLRNVSIVQNKSRITKSLASKSHSTALDIEMPHMLVLSSILCKTHLSLISAKTWPLKISEQCQLANMGGAEINMHGASDIKINLYSDLSNPIIERKVELEFSNGEKLMGYYPGNSNDFYSYLYCFNKNNKLTFSQTYEDNTLLQFFTYAYDYFFNGTDKPISDLTFHENIDKLLIQSRLLDMSLETKS